MFVYYCLYACINVCMKTNEWMCVHKWNFVYACMIKCINICMWTNEWMRAYKCMVISNGYLCIKPCFLAHGCVRWVYPLVETQKHYLWDCIESQLVWQRLHRIFANYIPPLVFTWDMVVWTLLVSSIFHYDAKSMDHGFHTNSRSVHVLLLVQMQFFGIRKEVQPLWEILSSTILYYIWKAQCSLVFHRVRAH